MTSLPEQLSAARKTQLEAQLELLRTLSTQAIHSAEQVIALNLNATRVSVEQSSAAVRQLLEARDPRDLLAFGAQTQQQFQQMMDYGRNLFSIAAGAQFDLAKAKLFSPGAAPVPAEPARAAEAAAPAATSVAPAPSAVPLPAAAAAPEPAPAPAAAAPEQPAPAAVAAPAPVAAGSQPNGADDAAAAIGAIAEAARSARPKKVVVAKEERAPDLGPKETPIASAAGQVAAASAAEAHPMASPLPANSGKIEIPKIKPVEASPPPPPVSGTPAIETKQAEQPSSKGPRRK